MKPDWKPIMMGTLGPVTSASRRPTLAPRLARATARLTATVVLPTPPLLLATAMMFFTPSTGFGPPGLPLAPRTSASMTTSTSLTPSTARIAASTSRCTCSRRGQAGVVSTMRTETRPSFTCRSRTMPSDTMSRCSSGSSTLLRAARISFSPGEPMPQTSLRDAPIEDVRPRFLYLIRLNIDHVATALDAAVHLLGADFSAQEPAQEVQVPLAGHPVPRIETAEHAIVVADLVAAIGLLPLGEAAVGVQDLGG